MRSVFQWFLLFGIGAIWSLGGVGKITGLFFIEMLDDVPLRWTDQFPMFLLVIVSVAEIAAAVLLFARQYKVGLLLGMLLLSCFSVAYWVTPPVQQGASCGCLGIVPTPAGISPMAHIVALSGLHVIAAASVWPLKHSVHSMS